MDTIILTGGGTGGHIYPNIALLPYLEQYFKIAYIGGRGETLECRLADENHLPYFGVQTIKLIRSFSFEAIKNNIAIPFVLAKSIFQCSKLLKEIQPKLVFSKGGFVALPVIISAILNKTPVICHESDITLGLSNKIGKLLGAKILTAYKDATYGEYVGMPLRKQLFKADKMQAMAKYNISTTKPILLVVGGSSGAKAINDYIYDNIDKLTEKYFVIHIYGKGLNNLTHNDYIPLPYSDDIPNLYCIADVVLSRAGATAIYELSALEKKCVLIPLPKAQSRGDQLLNANLAKEYGAFVVEQKNINDTLTIIDKALISSPMKKMCADTNGKIVDIIRDSIKTR